MTREGFLESLPQLVKNYRPNAGVLSAMANIKILATVGPTAVGKTTLMEELSESDSRFKFVLDETSRQPRAGEKQGVDLLFRSRDEIIEDARVGNLVQIAIGPNGDLYCTRLKSYPRKGVGLIPLIPAAVNEFRKLPINSFKAAFIVPATYELWQKWLSKQAEDSQWSDVQIKSRLQEAKQSFEFALADRQINFVLNDDTPNATRRLVQVADGKQPDDESLARRVAEQNYHKLLRTIDIE